MMARGAFAPLAAGRAATFAGLAAAAIAAAAAQYIRSRFRAPRIPSLPERPLSELLWALLRGGPHLSELLLAWRARYGRVYQGALPGRLVVYVSDPELVKRVLTRSDLYTKAEVAVGSKFVEMMLGQNVVFVNGETWRRQRRAMAGAFHSDAVQALLPVFTGCAGELADAIAAAKGAPVRVEDLMQRVTLDAVGRALFGYDFGALRDSGNETLLAYNSALKTASSPLRFLLPFLNSLPLESNREFYRSVATIDRLLYDLIDRERRGAEGAGAGGAGGRGARTLLSALVAAARPAADVAASGDGLTDRELRDNLVGFVVAGHETTASALCSALYLLALHPEIQERVHKDAVQAKGDAGRLEYTGQVIREAMRLYPPTFNATMRLLTEDDDLGPHRLPRGTLVSIPLVALHRDPELWPDPERFDPDRFAPGRSEGRHPFAYLPFIAGPRSCVGAQFSLLEQRALLGALLSRFRVSAPAGAGAGAVRFARRGRHILRPQDLFLRFEERPQG
eukprot:tig00020553_g10740.t1